MYPIINYDMVRSMHEERIRHALRPVPEWKAYEQQRNPSPRPRVRSSIAGALRRLAVVVDPQSSPATP